MKCCLPIWHLKGKFKYILQFVFVNLNKKIQNIGLLYENRKRLVEKES